MKKMLGIMLSALVIFAMVGCANSEENEGGAATSDVTVKDIMASIKAQIVQDIKDTGFDDGQSDEDILQGYMDTNLVDSNTDDVLGQMFFERTGLDQELLAEGSMMISAFNVNADEIIVLKAKDAKSVDTLKASLQKELDGQVQTWERYLPEQYEKVKNNVLKTKGNYLLYVTYENVDAVEKIFDEEVK